MKTLSDQTKVSLVTGACLLGLVVVLKNLVDVPAEVLSRDIVLYIIVYWALGMLPSQLLGMKPSRLDRPLVWAGLSVVITVAIVMVYAVRL